MSLFAVTIQALAPLFLLIVLGYGLKRARLLHSAHVPILNGLVVNVTMPALIVRGLASAPAVPAQTAWLPVSIIVVEIILAAIVFGCSRAFHLSRTHQGALLLVGIFGNTAFLGYPITLALLPHQFPAAILLDQFGMGIPMYTMAALIGAAYGGSTETAGARQGVLRFFRSPLFLSLVLGSLLREIPWPHAIINSPLLRTTGAIISQCLVYLGQGTTPVILLALGVALRPASARAHGLPLLLSCSLKLMVSPLLMWQVCRLIGIHGEMLSAGVLLAGMPTSVMASVLSGHHDMEGDFAVGTVFVSTILSAVTIPFWLFIVGLH